MSECQLLQQRREDDVAARRRQKRRGQAVRLPILTFCAVGLAARERRLQSTGTQVGPAFASPEPVTQQSSAARSKHGFVARGGRGAEAQLPLSKALHSAARQRRSREGRPSTATAAALSQLSSLAATPGLGMAVQAALQALGEVATPLLLGCLAYRRGLLTPQVLSGLSSLTVNVFIPSLLCGFVSRTSASMHAWGISAWLFVVPLCASSQIFLQYLLSGPFIKFIAGENPQSLKGRIMRLAMMFPNSAMPLIFAQALFRSQPDVLQLIQGAISFYLIGWSNLFWTLGFSIIEKAPTEDGEDAPADADVGNDEGASASLIQRLWGKAKRFLTPPSLAILLGLVIGLVPQLRSLLVVAADGSTPVLGSMLHGIENLGKAGIPCSQIVLAGSLARGLTSLKAAEKSDDDNTIRWGFRDLLAVILSRSVVGPLLCGYALWACVSTLLPNLAAAPVAKILAFTLLLEASMPSAQNAVVIPNLLGRPKTAADMATLYVSVYLCALPAASIWVALGLLYTGLSGPA
eukprot:TRINITY_DN23041_c0_g2_i1.p1 TRINITY_DN23041_c0_g2~~TRINITY_DN23041_c0_g2_i1.p1  ORF type:complete len:520 (+),score=117.65 TRINITY_DN23041_c0_g2_i1:80-1639(+)